MDDLIIGCVIAVVYLVGYGMGRLYESRSPIIINITTKKPKEPANED